MGYSTYLTLVNKLCARLNETPLDSSTFATSYGFYGHAKEAINSALNDIVRKYPTLPFMRNRTTFNTVVGINNYTLNGTLDKKDWDTFWLVANPSYNPPVVQKSLRHRDYNEYITRQYSDDVNAVSSLWSEPRTIIQDLTGNGCYISPFPDRIYSISYEGWIIPAPLSAYSDLCWLPDKFDSLIIDGAMWYASLFRENEEAANMWKAKFEDAQKELTRLLVPQDPYIKSSMIGKALPLVGPTRTW